VDFQNIADSLYAPTCIVSVEKKKDGGCGDIRIVAANQKYIDLITIRAEHNSYNNDDRADTRFIPGRIYTEYITENVNFENVCRSAAIEKREIHTYAHIHNVDIWFDIYVLPIEYADDNSGYCIYMAIPSNNADSILDKFSTSQTSSDVLKTCIKLHKANNLKDAMESVIYDIRIICKAEGCTVLLLNNEDEEFSILASNFVPTSKIKRVTEFKGYYNVANSWKDMLGDEGDCIIVRNEEDMDYVSRVNNPWYVTLVEAGVTSVALFPLRQGNELLGFIWAVNFDTENTMRIKETLELTTFFLSSHIARYKVLKRLEKMSYIDTLTGLPNRFACTEHITDLVNSKERFAAVSINLNNFKSINDTLGFDAGNKVLLDVSERWKEAAGRSGSASDKYLSRFGADEFFLVISGYRNKEELREVIRDYNDALTESLSVDGCDLYVTASFGYTEIESDDDTADILISHANIAMNEIKKANSSEHILEFTPGLLRDEHIFEIENKIRTALENDTFYFNLQPQYDMDHRLRGFESLARMKDSEGNIISPGEFIPVAEKVGLIDRVDGTVSRKAAMFFGELLRKTGAKLTLSLNVSVRHMMKSDFLDEIRQLLRDSGIPAEQLEIEITESIIMDSVDKALHCIDGLKRMGIQIAIDDFGTGYSSLSYLNKFPADLLKIDKSFIDAMNTGYSSRQYVAAIISMGHVMGFNVISEGVEDQEQLQTLTEINCDYVQGFIWGRPLSPEDAEKLVLQIFAK
jgi:diguanylate cyclase (GGDEF)-like protein